MAELQVSNLTYCYEGSFDNVFENVSFSVDTNWRLGFIGRNGKGKTTFLRLLLGKYEYEGSIATNVLFDYFPYEINGTMMKQTASEFLQDIKPNCEEWRVICELNLLGVDPEVLYRPFETLSNGERTKVLLAVLFSGDNEFLLIDEPTNHLDKEAREVVKKYLSGKNGFILVSHDRDLLDACIDHVLVLNRQSIEVQSGNFSVWWENKQRRDKFEAAENEKHMKEIAGLKKAADRADRWAIKNEATKIGFDPIEEPDRRKDTRGYIGAKTKKMQARVKSYEKRIDREISEKEGLLKDLETPAELKLYPLKFHKERLIEGRNLTLGYDGNASKQVLSGLNFELMQGERVFLRGENGCGKSSLIKAILENAGFLRNNPEYSSLADGLTVKEGYIRAASGLVISYINQDTSFLHGSLSDYCTRNGLDESLFYALLRQLDLERVQFVKNMEEFSEGQKKKVLIAGSLMTSANVYIWDEPLNYIDVFSRMQIEALILRYKPTMIVVEHDERFREKIATRTVDL